MNRVISLSRWLIATGALFVVLGIAHLAIAVPMGITAVETLPTADSAPLTMANIVTAVAVGMAGLLVIYCARANTICEIWARNLVLGAAVFLGVVGGGYVLATPDNPFAYVALVGALAQLGLSAVARAAR